MINYLKDPKNLLIAFLSMAVLFLVYFAFFRPSGTVLTQPANTIAADSNQATLWTCSMHPQIQLPKPGPCPICAMDLIPLDASVDEGGPWELVLSDNAQKLAGIRTAPVIRRKIAHEIRMVGKIDFDEKRVTDISARVPGRIQRLFVDATGIPVNKGDHLVALYSPDLVTAQQELRQAVLAYNSGPASLKDATARRMAAARKKLELLGMSESQVEEIASQEKPSDHITVQSPMSGIVIKKHLNEGAYVETGTSIYTVADLSRVWVVLEAYEADLRWLRFGQEVEFEVAAFPGEPMKGRIVFIDPTLNPATRTIKVRIDIPNPDGRLKPDMFVRAVAYASISPAGKVMDPSLAGKWISTMHPEIVKDKPGECDVCGMALVRAESLGFVTAEDQTAPLIIPASAALVTGERAVIYVASQEKSGSFSGREVVLGPQTGDFYVVKEGVNEGENVVVNGAFKIDSELQIRAKHSMMYPPSSSPSPKPSDRLDLTPAFSKNLLALFDFYFKIQKALAHDDFQAALDQTNGFEKTLGGLSGEGLAKASKASWQPIEGELVQASQAMQKAENLADFRLHFETMSMQMLLMASAFESPAKSSVYRFHCPMAFDNRGADWLQNHTSTENPYFGKAMFACGSKIEDLTPQSESESIKDDHAGGDHDHR